MDRDTALTPDRAALDAYAAAGAAGPAMTHPPVAPRVPPVLEGVDHLTRVGVDQAEALTYLEDRLTMLTERLAAVRGAGEFPQLGSQPPPTGEPGPVRQSDCPLAEELRARAHNFANLGERIRTAGHYVDRLGDLLEL